MVRSVSTGDFHYTDLSFKCRIGFVEDIRNAFAACPPERTHNLLENFGRTPFGPWLELTNIGQDPILVHMFLQLEVDVANADPEELYFNVCGSHMRFGRLEFCLVTGLCFGPKPSLPPLPEESFVRRVWPHHAPGNLKLRIVVQTMKDGLQALSDEDVIRVCLVVMVEMMFMGRELSQMVSDTVLRVVDDLGAFNSYPWGSHIWTHSYKQIHHAIARRNDKNNNKMTMNGFAHALKIWILEMFPVCRHNFTRRTDRVIRGTSWDRNVVLNKGACVAIFNSITDLRRGPLARLTPTDTEQQTSWYRDSVAFFEREATRRPTKRSRRRGPDDDDNEYDDDDEEDEDGARRDHSLGDNDRYEAPHRSSHHGVPPPDLYQGRWDYMESLHDYVHGPIERRIKELEDIAARFRTVQFGRTAVDYPITDQEREQYHNAREAYYRAHGGNEPPTYQSTQRSGLPISQVMPARLKKLCDEANADIEKIRRTRLHNMEIQKDKEKCLAEKKQFLAQMKREVREMQREIDEIEDEVKEIKESYTGIEEVIKEKSDWIIKIQEIYP
ncbi:hypothetical protein L6452_10971 [Arctium lappa]|uniref:Uncharacterized protein n=1 Tax=Arctium lappa TaxID=4217 RepID=A0ACB9DNT4_ARCLA|nr:hypothetical protein L6452_10971 [Arctium lappa]